MDVFAWTVVGSVAGVVGAGAVIVFGLVPYLRVHRKLALPAGDVSSAPVQGEVAGQVGVPGMPPRTLPRDVAAFTGREAETAELMRGLEDAVGSGSVVRICVIDGMAGVGKTTLEGKCTYQTVIVPVPTAR